MKKSTKTQRQLVLRDEYLANGGGWAIHVWYDPVTENYSATRTTFGTADADEQDITESRLGQTYIQRAISEKEFYSDELAPCGCTWEEICEECNPIAFGLAKKYGCKPSREF